MAGLALHYHHGGAAGSGSNITTDHRIASTHTLTGASSFSGISKHISSTIEAPGVLAPASGGWGTGAGSGQQQQLNDSTMVVPADDNNDDYGEEDMEPYREDVPPQLPYSLHERKWSILFIWSILILDSCVLPVALFFILKYAAKWDDTKNLGVSSGVFGFVSLLQYTLRFYRLLRPSSIYRPLGAPRWSLDFYQYQFTFGFILITVFVSVGVGPQDLRLIGLTPVLLPLQCAPQFLFSAWMYKIKWKIPIRFSSTPKGSNAPPAVFTIVEDVVAVDGRGGRAFRKKWQRRYNESWYFREMLYRLTLFWGFGAFACFGVTAAVVLTPSVDKYVAFAFGWVFPFVWAGIWALLTILYVQKELNKEQEVWSQEMNELRAREAVGRSAAPSPSPHPPSLPSPAAAEPSASLTLQSGGASATTLVEDTTVTITTTANGSVGDQQHVQQQQPQQQ